MRHRLLRYSIVSCIILGLIIFFKKSEWLVSINKNRYATFKSDSLFKRRNEQALILPLPNNYKIYNHIVQLNEQSKIIEIGNETPFHLKAFLMNEWQRIFNPLSQNSLPSSVSKFKNLIYRINYCAENLNISIDTLQHTTNQNEVYNIALQLDADLLEDNYIIKTDVYNQQIIINGNAKSLFYGIVSLLQLAQNHFDLESKKSIFKAIDIIDQPRFKYRGMHLDVVRHFFSATYIKKYIDILAFYKINKFHWHLTDDQGWRIEIKKYPRLIEVGSHRSETIVGRDKLQDNYPTDGKPHEGFYTQEEIKEIVRYAQEKN